MQVLSTVLALSFALAAQAKLPDDYQSLSAAEKEELVLENIVATEGEHGKTPNVWDGIAFAARGLEPSMDYEWDEMKEDRLNKVIHVLGLAGSAKFEAVENEYTGSFQGNDHVIWRISSAAVPSEDKIIPSIGIKFLLDGVRSTNFFGMYSINGQSSGNFFKNEMTNHIDQPEELALKLLMKKFETVSKHVTMVGLSDIAATLPNGDAVDGEINFPYMVTLVPSEEVQELLDDVAPLDALDAVEERIEPGMKIFDFYATPEKDSCERVLIGSFTTTSKFYKSSYGDQVLFFQHQRVEEDWELRPEWDILDRRLREVVVDEKEPPAKCPFGHG